MSTLEPFGAYVVWVCGNPVHEKIVACEPQDDGSYRCEDCGTEYTDGGTQIVREDDDDNA